MGISVDSFSKTMTKHGACILPEVVPMELIERMREGLAKSYENCRKIQLSNGLDNMEGTVHHLVNQDDSFADYLSWFGENLNIYAENYFGGKYIINSFGGNILSAGLSYAANIHRDIRSFSGQFPLVLNTVVMLDEFTPDNGATWLMDRGHCYRDKPSKKEFDSQKFQILGKAGTVVFFNSNMWHQAGENRTVSPRRSLTPMFCKPFIKPQFNYMGDSVSHLEPYIRQVLGYNSRIPKSLEEWYVPKDKRMYRDDQG